MVSLIDGRLEIIHFACLRRKAGRRRQLGIHRETRLPAGANIMVPRIGREEEIRIAMVRTDPLAIEPDSSGHIQDWQGIAIALFIFETLSGPHPAAARAAAA